MDVDKSNVGTAEELENIEADAKKKESAEQGRVAAVFKEIFWGTLFALFGYLLGGASLPFGARPLGAALLCASDKRIPYIFVGLCLGAWGTNERVVLICVYSAVLLIRVFSRLVLDPAHKGVSCIGKTFGEIYPTLFSEHLSLRMSSAAIAVFSIGMYKLAEGGFLYYDLYGTILSVILAPVAVLLFSGLFTSGVKSAKRMRYSYLCGFLSIAFAVILSAGDQKFYGISIATFSCMLVTLYTAKKHGIVSGMVAGSLCGLAVSVQLAPSFAFAALAAGMLFSSSSFLACASAFSVGIAWAAYARGIGILDGTLASLLASCILFAVIDKLYLSDVKIRQKEQVQAIALENVTSIEKISAATHEQTACIPLKTNALDSVRLQDTNSHIKDLCANFYELSEIFGGLGKRLQTPTSTDLRRICDNAFDSSCTGCPERSQCWGERYHLTSDEVGKICSVLHKNGRVEYIDADISLTSRCGRISDIIDEINHNASMHQKQILQGDRTEIFALDYAALSNLLSASMAKQGREYEINDELSQKLCAELEKNTPSIVGACVYGTRRRKVFVLGTDRGALASEREKIISAIKKVCAFEVELVKINDTDNVYAEFCETEKIRASYAQRTICADGEEQYCGDTVGLFKNPDGMFYSFISDGMGSGRDAALTSGVCGMFIKKLLGAGNSCNTTLDMLNGFLRNRGSGSIHECSATIDLMELDLMNSHASFYKCGAAPTYVFRDGSLFKIRSHTVPVGIIKEPDTRKIGFDVGEGDVIVMVSDGVTQGKEECPWLFDLLRRQSDNESVDRIADLVVKYAKGEGCADDISVLIIKITK